MSYEFESILRPSGEWVLLTGVTILDPDGWDRSDFNRSWFEPISRDEFVRRVRLSTTDWRSVQDAEARS